MLSVWSGIRPLVSDPNSKDTQSIARNHIITVGENNLITIAGGKWTTYRKMAEETVDKCVEVRKKSVLPEAHFLFEFSLTEFIFIFLL